MVYLPTFTIKINQMLVNIPYMDPMGIENTYELSTVRFFFPRVLPPEEA